MEKDSKIAYICGPLTELDPREKRRAKYFYDFLANLIEKITGKYPFVPHHYYDPKKHPNFSPSQVDSAERSQICEKTSFLVVAALAPSWGGGIEVEMANKSGVPVIILCKEGKRLSRLLEGNPSVREVIIYSNREDLASELESVLKRLFSDGSLRCSA